MKILIKIKNDRLQFINKKKLNTEYKNMLNTNVISNNELVFSDEYILYYLIYIFFHIIYRSLFHQLPYK